MKHKDLEILLKKLSSKEKGSRQYNIIENRIKKSLKQESRFREVRYNEKSLEISKEISKISENDVRKLIKFLISKQISKNKEVKI